MHVGIISAAVALLSDRTAGTLMISRDRTA